MLDYSQPKEEIFEELKAKGIIEFALGTKLKTDAPIFINECNPEWFQHYHSNNYLMIDPVVTVSTVTTKPIRWDHLLEMYPDNKVMNDAQNFYDLKCGYAMPCYGLGAGSIVLEKPILKQQELKPIENLFKFFLESLQSNNRALSVTEVGIAQCMAAGETVDNIAMITGLKKETVKKRIQSICAKQGWENTRKATPAIIKGF